MKTSLKSIRSGVAALVASAGVLVALSPATSNAGGPYGQSAHGFSGSVGRGFPGSLGPGFTGARGYGGLGSGGHGGTGSGGNGGSGPGRYSGTGSGSHGGSWSGVCGYGHHWPILRQTVIYERVDWRTRLVNVAQIVPNQYYAIIGVQSGKALEVRGGPSAATVHEAIQQWDFAGADNQLWRLAPTADGYFEIFSKDTNLGLDVPWGSMDNSTPIQLYPLAASDNQRWSLVPAGNGSFLIVGQRSGKGLAVAGGSMDNGGDIVQYQCENTANEDWYLVPMTPTGNSAGDSWTVTDAQKEAILRYPDLGVAGSTLNAAFVARNKYYLRVNPSYFIDPRWPLSLADEIALTPSGTTDTGTEALSTR